MLCDSDAEIVRRKGVFLKSNRNCGAIGDQSGDDVTHLAVKVEVSRQKNQ